MPESTSTLIEANMQRMTTLRAIDRDQSVRTKPMRILCLGASRTGTSSLRVALNKLGYRTFHMHECLVQGRRFFPLWMEALDAKFFGRGRVFGKAEFDKILAEFDAVSDVPCILFADELLEFYPDTKVILTDREPEKWIASMQQTIYLFHSWTSWDWLKYWNPGVMRLWRECDLRNWDAWLGQTNPGRRDFTSKEYGELSKQRMIEHNQHIRKIVPSERLLVWKPVDGWKPLGKFLDCETPEEDFPHVWDAQTLSKLSKRLWWICLGNMVVATTVLPVGLAVGGWYWYRSK